jgi:hypothetical protein
MLEPKVLRVGSRLFVGMDMLEQKNILAVRIKRKWDRYTSSNMWSITEDEEISLQSGR